MSSTEAYSLVLLTGAVAALAGLLAFAVLRFAAAARDLRARTPGGQTETAFMTTALQEAVERLRVQERALEARAEASEQLSDEIVAGIASGLLVVEHGGVVRLANPAAVRLLGLDESQVSGTPVRELLRNAPALADVIEEALRTARPVVRRTLTIGEAVAGSVKHLGVTVSPIVAARRQEVAAVCLFTDLTDAMAREEQLRLKESLARLGELTAGIAHEFRNGLATIHGYARMLDPARLPDDAATYVNGIREETEALGQVVTNFLNFARPAQMVLGPVDLGAIVARLADDWRPETERRGGRVDVIGEFATVEGDEVLLRQAIDNLCRNAVQAAEAAGHGPVLVITGRTIPSDRQLAISVADNGPGIDPAVAGRLFQPFFTTRGNGTGLGLALVQKIVVTHNGRITAANRPEGGAVFELRLPVEAAALTKA